jgi:hypothetical protein
MYHGIYVKSKPKNKWFLVGVSISAEEASNKLTQALTEAKKDGFEKAEAAIKIFEYIDYIPEMLNEIKPQPLLYN